MLLFVTCAILYNIYRARHPWCIACRAQGVRRVPATVRAPHPRWAMRFPFCARCAVTYLD